MTLVVGTKHTIKKSNGFNRLFMRAYVNQVIFQTLGTPDLEYIQKGKTNNQAEHHRKKAFAEEYSGFLEKHNLE